MLRNGSISFKQESSTYTSPLQGLTRVEEMAVLGITFTHSLSFAPHILKITGKAAASLNALKTLKAHGLHGQALCDVTQATLVAQQYCSTKVQHGPGSSKRMKKRSCSLF